MILLALQYYIGQVSLSGEIAFQLNNAATPVFTLTCTSTGGPATTVSWRRDGTMLSDDSNHDITSQMTDSVTATYTHTLTVTGRRDGLYQCSVSNIRTPSTISRSLTVGKKTEIQDGLCLTTWRVQLQLILPGSLQVTHQVASVLHKRVLPVSESPGLHQSQELLWLGTRYPTVEELTRAVWMLRLVQLNTL